MPNTDIAVEDLVYSSAPASPITNNSEQTPATAYASVAAALTALNSASVKAVAEMFDNATRTFRGALSVGINGTAGQTVNERLYLIVPTKMQEVAGIELWPIGLLQWQASGVTIPTAQGGASNQKYPQAVSFTTTNLLENLTGRAPAIISQTPAVFSIPDIGPGIGVLRSVWIGTATNFITRIQKWL